VTEAELDKVVLENKDVLGFNRPSLLKLASPTNLHTRFRLIRACGLNCVSGLHCVATGASSRRNENSLLDNDSCYTLWANGVSC
jgi:hypothetical protein